MAPRWPPHGPRECCGIRDVQGGLIESTLAYTQFCKRLREQVPYTRDLKRQNQPGVSGSGFGFSYNYMAGSTLDRLTSNIEGHAQECPPHWLPTAAAEGRHRPEDWGLRGIVWGLRKSNDSSFARTTPMSEISRPKPGASLAPEPFRPALDPLRKGSFVYAPICDLHFLRILNGTSSLCSSGCEDEPRMSTFKSLLCFRSEPLRT